MPGIWDNELSIMELAASRERASFVLSFYERQVNRGANKSNLRVKIATPMSTNNRASAIDRVEGEQWLAQPEPLLLFPLLL